MTMDKFASILLSKPPHFFWACKKSVFVGGRAVTLIQGCKFFNFFSVKFEQNQTDEEHIGLVRLRQSN
jgi:hypothetical protein